MVIRFPALPSRRTSVPGAMALLGVLVLVGCGDGSTVDNPDEAAPSTTATVLSQVETRDPTTTEAAEVRATTTVTTAVETTTTTIVSTTTSRPGKTLTLVAPPSTIRSTTSSTAAPATTSPPATTAPSVTTPSTDTSPTDTSSTTVASSTASTTAPPATAVPTATTDADGSTTSDAGADGSPAGSDAAAADGEDAPAAPGAESDAGAQNGTDSQAGSSDDPGNGGSEQAADGEQADESAAGTESAVPLVPGVVSRPTCASRPDGEGRVACAAELRNSTDVYTRISTSVAFFDSEGTQLSTENRFMNYVAPGEVFLQEFYGPAATARADVLASTPTAIAEPQTGEARTSARGVYLPVDAASVEIGALSADPLGRQTSIVTVINSSDVAGTVTVKVAFFDTDGLRVSNESRFVQGVGAGESVTQKFFGDADAVSIRLLEIKVVPAE